MKLYSCREDRRFRFLNFLLLTLQPDKLGGQPPHCIDLELKLIPQTTKLNEIGGQHDMKQLRCALTISGPDI